jgi:phospholipid-translocating ATPase
LLAILCIITSVGSPAWEEENLDFTNFIESAGNIQQEVDWAEWFMTLFDSFWYELDFNTCSNSLITYQNVVPISLYLTVEVVKTAQAFFIYMDLEMYYEPLDAPCVPRSWNLADDLGQIEYIFSDKTGTLTRNIMDFRMCSINGVIYGNMGVSEGRFNDALLKERLANPSDPHHDSLCKFFTALAVCHSVLVSNDSETLDGVEFKASSPDEAALVKGAKDVGFVFIGRDNDTLVLNVLGKEVRYKILNVLEVCRAYFLIFSSTLLEKE